MKTKHGNGMISTKTAALVLAFALAAALAGCGGGGGGRGISRESAGPGVLISPAPWYPPSLNQIVRTTAEFDNVTYYLPALEQWYLYDATEGDTWISAIGSTPGLSASMTNPFKEVGVMFIPTDTYNNPGQVNFYIDGKQVGSLNLSQAIPYKGYSDDSVSYYKIADNLPETTHTVTMIIATGTVAFDGWRMTYRNQMYDIDCRDSNTLEYDTVTETEKLRDGIESFYQDYLSYPDTSDFSDLISYLNASGTVFTRADTPKNPFTDNTMVDSSVYSAGDYHYTFTSANEYTLIAYGGRGTLTSYTQSSAATDRLALVLTSPEENHFATTSPYITFSGTTKYTADGSWGGAYLTICCGLSGTTSFPATDTFSSDIKLKEGKNNLVVALKDPFGHKITLTRTITRDTTAPEIFLVDPSPLVLVGGTQQVNVYSTPATVSAYVEPKATATLNGAAVTVDSNGIFETSLDLNPGDNTITITSTDSCGNTASAVYTIVLH
jgi:hypothetical protein